MASDEAVGIEEVSRVRLISSGLEFSFDGITDDGEGERTTEGIGEAEMESGAVMTFGFQVLPGLIIKLIVSPSLILYSLRSLASASALPLSKRR